MQFIGDFHIHSKYSRATSPQMDLDNMAEWAGIKGIDVITCGDFTHPLRFKTLKERLEPAEDGLYKLRPQSLGPKLQINSKFQRTKSRYEIRFILTTEISCIYSKNNRVRKIHIVVFAPSLEVVEKINNRLSSIGNLRADGRPILGLDAEELAKIILSISEECLIVPAHILTPWFGIFGSKSGFNSIEECFEDYSKYIYALETGLSASPDMIWRIPDARKLTLVSNSDAHSLKNIAREANVFEGEDISYKSIVDAIKRGSGVDNNNSLRLAYTIEFYPQEGKYYYDGHRKCNVSLSPQESKKYNNICPVCGRPLTIGVLNRVEQLADKPVGYMEDNAIPFKSLVPLKVIISEVFGKGKETKQVDKEYKKLITQFGSELNILLNVDQDALQESTVPLIAEGIIRIREGKVRIEPGYDGFYGKVSVFSKGTERNLPKQGILFGKG